MNEPLKRRNLLASPSTPDPLPQEAIAAVAARNGFLAAVSPPAPPSIVSRRKRQPTGRDHQFNVRLRRETLEFIYCQANGRNIPVAQVIEEACEALQLGLHTAKGSKRLRLVEIPAGQRSQPPDNRRKRLIVSGFGLDVFLASEPGKLSSTSGKRDRRRGPSSSGPKRRLGRLGGCSPLFVER
jgi:hypothetical protein